MQCGLPALLRSVLGLGRRVVLAPLREESLGVIEAWYEEAARAAHEEGSIGELRVGDLLAIIRPGDDEPIGLLQYEAREGWLTVAFIALAKPYRGWGYGSEAVRLLEEWAIREGVAARFRADVDVHNGLGLYFWLRLGYRPASADEFDWQRTETRDKMPMVRVNDSARM